MRWSPGRWEWPGLQSFFLDGVSAAVVNERSSPMAYVGHAGAGTKARLLPRGPREDMASSRRGLLQHEALEGRSNSNTGIYPNHRAARRAHGVNVEIPRPSALWNSFAGGMLTLEVEGICRTS